MILTCSDRNISYKKRYCGCVEASEKDSADFHFLAPYSTWVTIARGKSKIQGEVVGGRVKLKGSMPKMLLYVGKLAGMERRMTKLINDVGTEFL